LFHSFLFITDHTTCLMVILTVWEADGPQGASCKRQSPLTKPHLAKAPKQTSESMYALRNSIYSPGSLETKSKATEDNDIAVYNQGECAVHTFTSGD
jgi:hypothetical protein